MVKLLDCTLREAPVDGMMWGETPIKKVIAGLEYARIDVIEVGFLKNVEYKKGSTIFCHTEDIEPYLKNKRKDILYVALVDYGRYDVSNLSPYDGKTVDAIRVCFKHSEIRDVLQYAEEIRKKGYKVCVQHVDTLGYTDSQILSFVKEINSFKPYAYSIVDTFGAMLPEDVKHYTELINENLDEDIVLGFHAHNNMMLANSNVQFFIKELQNRDIIVDASLHGCGRSAGNAHTELIAYYVNRIIAERYSIDAILDVIDTVVNATKNITSWGYSIPYFISGMYNAHSFNVNYLTKRHNVKSSDLRGIIGMLNEKQKKEYNYDVIENLYVQYFDRNVNDSMYINKIISELRGRDIVLLGPGKSVINKKDDILKHIDVNNSVVIGVNNIIDDYVHDYIFYSSTIRYDNLQYCDYESAGSPRIIVTSNVSSISKNDEYVVNYGSLIKRGWINIDSSFILLVRLLMRCKINCINAAGLDGYRYMTEDFYNEELDMNLDNDARIEQVNDNISMLYDIKKDAPKFNINFLTESIYSEVFK